MELLRRSRLLKQLPKGTQTVSRTAKSSPGTARTNEELVQPQPKRPAPGTMLSHCRQQSSAPPPRKDPPSSGVAKQAKWGMSRVRRELLITGSPRLLITGSPRLRQPSPNPCRSPASEDSDTAPVSGSRRRLWGTLQGLRKRAAWCTGREWPCWQILNPYKALLKTKHKKFCSVCDWLYQLPQSQTNILTDLLCYHFRPVFHHLKDSVGILYLSAWRNCFSCTINSRGLKGFFF